MALRTLAESTGSSGGAWPLGTRRLWKELFTSSRTTRSVQPSRAPVHKHSLFCFVLGPRPLVVGVHWALVRTLWLTSFGSGGQVLDLVRDSGTLRALLDATVPVVAGPGPDRVAHWAPDAQGRLEELVDILQGLSDDAGGSDYADADAAAEERQLSRAAAKEAAAAEWALLIASF